METISGIVEKTNTKTGNGLCVGGVWYNACTNTKKIVETIAKGEFVEMEILGKSIQAITKVKSADPVAKSSPTSIDEAMLHSIEFALKLDGWGEESKRSFAITHFIASTKHL